MTFLVLKAKSGGRGADGRQRFLGSPFFLLKMVPPAPFSVGILMTFDEKRESLLKQLDAHYASLRAIVADPKWCNEDCPPYKNEVTGIHVCTRKLAKLNLFEME
jgi:hypothetical protein